MPDDKLVDKIRKILRRADESRNDSDAERDIAMRKAQALLIEHGLTMSDIGNLDDEKLPEGRGFESGHAFVTARTEGWRGTLLSRIAAVYFCKAYYTRRSHSKIWTLLGRTDHVQATEVMFGWVEPQLEAAFNRQLENMGPYQRLARKYALLVAGVPIHMVDRQLADTTDEELAEIGALELERIRDEHGPEAALLDIQRRLGVSRNYSKHVRVHINKRDIAPTVARSLNSWRETWFDYATATIGRRLDAIQREEAEKFGSKGTDLVVNEKQALQVFMDEIGLELTSESNKVALDPHAVEAGAAVGASVDLRPGHRVEDNSDAIALGPGE